MRQQAGFLQTFWNFPKGQEWRENEKKRDLLTNKLVLYTPLVKPKGPGLEQDAKKHIKHAGKHVRHIKGVKHL